MSHDESNPQPTSAAQQTGAGAPREEQSVPEANDARGPDSFGDERLQSLMKRALSAEEETSGVDVLSGVQDKLRQRSGGKFYRDGWSTSRHPPFATYFITSLMMLSVIAIIYAILTPLVGEPVPVDSEPKPVRVIPPR